MLPGRLPERYSPSGISVLIVGAGVAGLMASLECWRKGHDVRIIEKSASRLLSGDGFTIGESAIRALSNWPDMADENVRIAFDPWVSWHKITGEKISGPAPIFEFVEKHEETGGESNNGQQEDVQAQPKRIYRHSRPKFHKMLTDQAERIGIYVEYGKRVTEYYEKSDKGKAGVVLENGETIEADIVLAADGIGSKSTKITMGREVRAQSTGFAVYRTAFPIELAFADPIVRERFQLLENGHPVAELWMGDGIHAMFGRSHDEMTWAINYPVNVSGTTTESWSALVDPETVLQVTSTIAGWPEVANRVILSTPKDRLHDFKLMWRDPQPCWVSPSGRVVQLGDAAHTFLPSSGNGATQGLEDAISLAACLQLGGKDGIPWATRVHNKLRFERVACLQKLGIVNHETRQRSSDADAKQARPIGLLAAWALQHNPEQYAVENYEKALAHLLDGKTFQNTNIPPGYVYKPWTIGELLSLKKSGKEIELGWDCE
ncbi:hypothetical protein Plec18167_000628 [Paecilomyces lecythidis]|uniref:FAD-binding domain-containing protein n=1 Tax=Paecilomyces lecythidis TaxID=3004212 RepID=A0ABR3YEY7_9EURO